MKLRTLSFLLVLCLVMGAFCGCVSKKTNDPIPTGDGIVFDLPEVAASAGEKVTLPILVNADSNVAAVDFVVTYDSDLIAYNDFSAGSAFKLGIAEANEPEKGTVKITMATLTSQKDAGRMCELTFTVTENATPCEIPVTLTCTDCCDYDTNKLAFTCQNGVIIIK